MMESRVILQPDPEKNVLYAEGRLGGFEKNMMLQWTGKEKIQPFPCDSEVCDKVVKGKKIRFIRTVSALRQACRDKADLIITRYYLDWDCRGSVVIDRHVLEKHGGQAIWLGNTIKVKAVRPKGQGMRPWHQ